MRTLNPVIEADHIPQPAGPTPARDMSRTTGGTIQIATLTTIAVGMTIGAAHRGTAWRAAFGRWEKTPRRL